MSGFIVVRYILWILLHDLDYLSWNILNGMLNFKYIWDMPEMPDIFGVNSRFWDKAYITRKTHTNHHHHNPLDTII